ncbi:MerR family transcriptional regulator [Nocardia cyriacigeorgica]|uniref:MerR family transcriptional regulator n=1 Tax=Nocardia cyriacigeorgica TaxID=135487 RepID=UPI0018941AE8|nr:MerR family transcriptional regulator [Nocardia cyriacigeorgica]MBF6086190.1 MerR family transcriptional regulator [Nocardia cyriacigeorgica]MBF6092281.1 MerR family transcriptional regulator [Nocardia cyriacigeorgica]MBF6396874.1 MerR family transcriptional regulator [Nocardia cyriacigeorgica]MBF6403468.1 MerR family transcriptional regulator [Nocardia cyriacigeorgica]
MVAGTRTGEWSIQDLAKAAGTTSRTLRHYGELGLLPPSRIGTNGYRYYDQDSLVRLQRILLLRELGLGLPVIADVLAGEQDTTAALHTHLELLRQEQDRIRRRIESVNSTLRKMERGEKLVAAEVFDGFDHTQYKDEVIERWGKEAYESGDRWWRSLSEADKQAFQRTQLDIAADFGRAHAAGLDAGSDEVQAITQRHYEWLTGGYQGKRPGADHFAGLGEMYVADPRFGQNYDRHGEGTAEFVRDAMRIYADRNLR